MGVNQSVGKERQPKRLGTAKKTVGAKSGGRAVKFVLNDPAAGEVCLAGDFNNWDVRSFPLKKSKQGIWSTTLKLLPGRYEYNFVADGNWVPDESCIEMVTNPFGTRNSVVEVS